MNIYISLLMLSVLACANSFGMKIDDLLGEEHMITNPTSLADLLNPDASIANLLNSEELPDEGELSDEFSERELLSINPEELVIPIEPAQSNNVPLPASTVLKRIYHISEAMTKKKLEAEERPKTSECSFCHKFFFSTKGLEKHILSCQENDEPSPKRPKTIEEKISAGYIECSVCHRYYKNKISLKQHRYRDHNKSKS